VEFVAFIDDDEVPSPTWLDELLNVQKVYEADVVAGPVLPQFDVQVPPWMLEGGFFERPRYPTGHPLTYVATNNVLLHSRVFKEIEQGFDERLALTGGSDTHFFLRAHCAGYKMVFADEAIVHEWNPPSRVNTRWILQRAFRKGNSLVFYKTYLDSSMRMRILLLAVAGRSALRAVWAMRLFCSFGKPALIRSLQSLLNGVGILTGLAGYMYKEYHRPHVE
jgi:GT2 family glycosyltransferase